jgi:hypothetical protein
MAIRPWLVRVTDRSKRCSPSVSLLREGYTLPDFEAERCSGGSGRTEVYMRVEGVNIVPSSIGQPPSCGVHSLKMWIRSILSWIHHAPDDAGSSTDGSVGRADMGLVLLHPLLYFLNTCTTAYVRGAGDTGRRHCYLIGALSLVWKRESVIKKTG